MQTADIYAAVDAAAANGGGRVHIPAGTYVLDREIFFGRGSGVHITGDGPGATILKRADNTPSGLHVFSFYQASHFSVRDLTIDGNRATQTYPGHGIRMDDVSRFYIGNVEILNAHSYGVGFQGGDAFKQGTLENLWIENTGGDGIDFKNRSSANKACVISKVIVIDPGMTTERQAALDIRGPVMMDNITVLLKTTQNKPDGIRLRPGEDEPGTNGLGGHYSSLVNFHVEVDPSLPHSGRGVAASVRGFMASNGFVSRTMRGVQAGWESQQCAFRGIIAKDTALAFEDLGVGNLWPSCVTAMDAAA